MEQIKHLRPTTLAAIIADLEEAEHMRNDFYYAVRRALVCNVGPNEADRMVEAAKD